MTDEQILTQFWAYHKDYLHDYAVKVAYGWSNRRDAEEGLNDAVCSLAPKIVKHCAIFGIEDRIGHVPGEKWCLWQQLLWRIKSRVWSARKKSLRHEQPGGIPVLAEDALDNRPGVATTDSTDGAKDTLVSLPEKFRVLTNGLSLTEKRVIELTVLRDPPMPDEEAASVIGTTLGVVKVRRCDALRKIRHTLIRAAILGFPPAENKVIELTVLRKPPMKDEDAALEIGIAPDAVKDIRGRVLEKIQLNFEKQAPNPTTL